MKNRSTHSPVFIAIGLFLFFIGLLMFLQQATISTFFTQMLPTSQMLEILGVLLQFLGGFLVIYGVIKSVSDKIIVNHIQEKQTIVLALAQTRKNFGE
jgi:uncharacterized integral membrane protein